MNSVVGTRPLWMAPEVLDGHYIEKADVFSLGVLFYAILERDFIEVDGKKFYCALCASPVLFDWESLSKVLRDGEQNLFHFRRRRFF